MLVLKTNELEKYLVVARCTEMCFRMHRVPRIFPIAKTRRKSDLAFNAGSLATTAPVVLLSYRLRERVALTLDSLHNTI
jgi:hypothetical protein